MLALSGGFCDFKLRTTTNIMLEALLPVVSEPFRMREVSLLPVSFVMTNLPLAFYVMVIKGLALVSTASGA